MFENVARFPGSTLIYFGAMVLSSAFALLAQLFPRVGVIQQGQRLRRAYMPNRFWLTMAFAVMVALAGARGLCGTDTASYRLIFADLLKGPNEPLSQRMLEGGEYGFVLINYVAIALSRGCNFVFVLSMILFGYFFMIGLDEYHETMSVALAVLGLYCVLFFPTLNVMRQMIAVAIAFFGMRFIYERKFAHFLLFVLLARMFHSSALVCLPIYFVIGNDKLRPVLRYGMYLGIAAMCVSISLLTTLLGAVFADSSYANYIGMASGPMLKLTTPLLRLPFLLPVLLFRKRLIAHDRRNEMWIVLAITEFLFAQLGSFEPTFARIAFYFRPSWLILLPQLTRAMPTKATQRAMGTYTALNFLLYWYMNSIMKNFGGVLPYDTFFAG